MTTKGKYALEFNGTSSYVNTGNPYNYDIVTVEAWAKVRTTGRNQAVIENMENCGYGIAVAYSGTKWGGTVHINGSYYVAYSDELVTTNEWTHIAMTYDGNIIKLYINGRLQSQTISVSGVITDSTYNMFIGANPGATTIDFFDGYIDEVRIWNRALSQKEIQKNMNRMLFGTENGLVGYWRFDEGAGNTAYDLTVNKRNGAIYNATWVESTSPVYYIKYLIQDKNNILFSAKDSLIANYKFDEISGTTCIDSKGNYNGTYNGTTNVTDTSQGISNTYRTFNGTSDYISYNAKVIPIGKKSIRFKIKKSSTISGRWEFLLSNQDPSSRSGFCMFIDTTGHLGVSYHNNNTWITGCTSPNIICDNLWHDIIFIQDTSAIKLFIDNFSTEVISASIPTSECIGNTNLNIGKQGGTGTTTTWFAGNLDEIEIYNDTIQFDEVGNLGSFQVDILNGGISEQLFINKGFDIPTTINNKGVIRKGIYAIDKGTLGSGKLFEFDINEIFKTINSIE